MQALTIYKVHIRARETKYCFRFLEKEEIANMPDFVSRLQIHFYQNGSLKIIIIRLTRILHGMKEDGSV